MAALRNLSLLLLACLSTGNAPDPSDAEDAGSRCGSAEGAQRAASLALDAHLRALVDAAPAGSARVLSTAPLIVSVTVARADDPRLRQIIDLQLPAQDRDDGWYMSPNGAASTAISAALAATIGAPFDGTHLEPLQVVRNTGAHATDHHQDFRSEDLQAPWGPRVLSAHLFLNSLAGGRSPAAGGLHFPQAGENPCGEDTPREVIRKRECGLTVTRSPGVAVLWPNVQSNDVLCASKQSFHREIPAELSAFVIK